MNKSICNICGGNLINKDGRWVCESCGAFLPEEITNEQLALLYNANQKLRLADFDAAEEMFSDVIGKYGDCSDAYFGRALAKYGIRFEKDVDGRMVPTCFFPEYQSLYENNDFKKAYDLADSKQKQYLKEKADEIEAIRKEWVEKAKKEGPYDIFISFKATEAEDGTRETEDSREAWDIAKELEKSGYRVFFSKDALENKTGDHYEPYIFNAINTCHVMLVYASKPEYVNSVWVRNEWVRYWKKIKNKEEGKLPNSLILIYKNFNPSKELGRPFSHNENINRNDIDFLDRLKKCVSAIISESKVITPKIIPSKIESYVPMQNERLKGIRKRKAGNSIFPNESFVPMVQAQEKTFGKYSTQKLTATSESKLLRGDVLLSKKLYEDALKCYKEVLSNDRNNAKAALGVLLSSNQCTTLKELIFDKYVGSDEQNELINTVIEYSEKDVSNKLFEQVIAFIKIEIQKGKNIEVAYKAYKEIKDFNSSKIIRECHEDICDELLKKKCFDSNVCFSFLDDILLNRQTQYTAYTNTLLKIINALIDVSMFVKAGYYLKMLEKVDPRSKDYFTCFYEICSKQNSLSSALLTYVNDGKIQEIVKDIDNTNTETANWILDNLIRTIIASSTKISTDKLSESFSILKNYANPSLDILTEDLMTYCVSNPNIETDKLFENVLQSFPESRKKEFIDCIFAYARAYMERSNFVSARKYLNFGLKYDQTNLALLNCLLYASVECVDEKEGYRNFYKLKDFSIIEKILGLQKNEDVMEKENAKFVAKTILYVSEYGKNANKGIFDVFEQLIKYYPAHSVDQLIKDLYNMADICKEKALFAEAEKYYAFIVGTDSSEHAAYWGLLQAKLKCRSEPEMVKQETVINTFPEFNNAIASAGNNKTVIERYIDCSIKQQKYIEKKKKRRKIRKAFAISSTIATSILLVLGVVFALVTNVFIPNSRYENALSLINNGEYSQAYEQLKDFDYADSSSQLSIAKAGMAFNLGDYQEGVECIYNVGGVTNVSYDGNGGKAPANKQTIKKAKNLIDNDPIFAGYNFYGWTIDSFSIKTRKNDYSCDLKLKATWQLVNYSISYVLHGSTLKNKVEEYNCLSKSFSIGKPEMKGYTFDGWTGTGLSKISKDVVIPSGSIGNRVYKAHFTPKEYKVTYDYGYNGNISETSATYDSPFKTETPSRKGYDFEGWTYNGDPFENRTWDIDSDITLLAHWKAKKYRISYILNGGNNSPSNLSEYTVETPTFSLSAPNKDGYDFTGWSGEGISGVSKDVIIEKGSTGDRTYMANWKPHTYTVNLDSRGGECSTLAIKVDYGNILTLPLPTRKGYTFAGWFNVKDNVEISDCTWNFLTDLDLYAKWNAGIYTIRYSLNGGTNHVDNPVSYTIEDKDFSIKNPSKDGYTFAGWDSALGIKQFLPTIHKGSTGDISFSANWAPNLNTIIFNGNGNTSGEMNSVQGYTDSTIKLPSNSFIKTGYHFKGWSFTEKGTAALEEEASFIVGTLSIVNLYAVWEANVNTITFHGNGADEGEMEKESISTDETQNLSSNGFSKAGYHFVGWSKSSTGQAEYDDGQEYLMGAENNYDLYAVWQPNEYVISYNPNGGQTSKNSDKVLFDSQYTLNIPTRDGYIFSGWYIGETQLTNSNAQSLEKYGIAGDITAIAHWIPNMNAVLMVVDGTTTKVFGETESFIRLPKIEETKTNYIFMGWSNTTDGDVLYKNEDLYKIGPKSSYTLYGVWKDVSDYTPISTCDELKNIEANGKYYLAKDIDCKDVEWSPLLNYDTPFMGEFFGNGHYIFNVNMKGFKVYNYSKCKKFVKNGDVIERYFTHTGLFCKVGEKGIISDVNVRATISGQLNDCCWSGAYSFIYDFGGICGLNEGTVKDCTTSLYFDNPILDGAVKYGNHEPFTANIGGIAGTNNGTISNCFSYLNGTKITTRYIDKINYYGTAVFNDGGSTTYNDVNNCISSSTGKTASLDLDGKKAILVLIEGKVDSIFWINNYEPFMMSEIYKPTKNGFTLTGWKYEEHIYSPDEYIYPDYVPSILVEPIFAPNETSLILNANNGMESETKEILIKTDESVSLKQYVDDMTVPYGYHFVGWSSTKDGSIEYKPKGTFTSNGDPKTLYAIWEPNENSIVFNGNGGEGDMETQSIKTNETVTLKTCSFIAPKGCYFAGWSLSPNGEVEYTDCSNITSDGTSVINLYAVWKPIV